MSEEWLNTLYILIGLGAAASFVIGLHYMNSPATARQGNRISAVGMAVAVIATLAYLLLRPGGLSTEGLIVILVGGLIGGAAGLLLALRVAMTAMPQLVSLFNAVGGGAAALVAIFDYLHVVGTPEEEVSTAIFVILGVLIGSVTFTGSLIASAKLQGLIRGKPIPVPGGTATTAALGIIALAATVLLVLSAGESPVLAIGSEIKTILLLVILGASLTFGVTMVLPIGGADMPVVISLLNSFTGTAAAMSGFVLESPLLIIAGALVGAAGGILTKLMADAMNRSIMNILIGGFGGAEGTQAEAVEGGGTVREVGVDDAAIQLAYAQSVIVVPGYGLAVAQAQHAVRELGRDPRGARRQRRLRHPPGGGTDARPHERPPRRGERALSAAAGDGGHQPRVPPRRRGPRGRRQRRHEPRRALGSGLADLRHAHPRRGRGQEHRRHQALDGPGLRRHRQPALHEPQDRHALRRRQGRPRAAHGGRQGAVAGAGAHAGGAGST